MTDLDRRVAKWRGWHIDEQGRVLDSSQMFQYWLTDYPYETNLAHAFELWDEARPEGWLLKVTQMMGEDGWMVQRYNMEKDARCINTVQLADLPRAITEAWVEAMEATCQK